VLDSNNNCIPVPIPDIIDSCPDNCSHTCYLNQCTCPDDMYLDPENRATCRNFNEIETEKPIKKKKNGFSVAGCEALEYDESSMEIHYSKTANSEGKFEKGTVVRGKCR
jgi:hypothetical protein